MGAGMLSGSSLLACYDVFCPITSVASSESLLLSSSSSLSLVTALVLVSLLLVVYTATVTCILFSFLWFLVPSHLAFSSSFTCSYCVVVLVQFISICLPLTWQERLFVSIHDILPMLHSETPSSWLTCWPCRYILWPQVCDTGILCTCGSLLCMRRHRVGTSGTLCRGTAG